jgi:4-hydroxybenzoate polyprenyltransferase
MSLLAAGPVAAPLQLVRAAHPLPAVLTALGVAGVATAAGRPLREVGLVAATVLVGQVVLGWLNDLVDRRRDAARARDGKPLATGSLDTGTAWFAAACGVLLLVPLALANGVTAGSAYLLAVAVAALGTALVPLRRSAFSWLPWAASYGLLPAFVTYGGWGGAAEGDPPTVVVTVLAALLGVAVHVLLALPGLVADNEDGFRHLPLRLALRTGAPLLLWISAAVAVFLLASMVVAAATTGLQQ